MARQCDLRFYFGRCPGTGFKRIQGPRLVGTRFSASCSKSERSSDHQYSTMLPLPSGFSRVTAERACKFRARQTLGIYWQGQMPTSSFENHWLCVGRLNPRRDWLVIHHKNTHQPGTFAALDPENRVGFDDIAIQIAGLNPHVMLHACELH